MVGAANVRSRAVPIASGAEARRPLVMSSMRQDPSQRSGPMGRPRGYAPERADDVLSVVVPAKNEAASLPQLVEELERALRPLLNERPTGPRLAGFEIVVVDDGSTDDSPAVLRRLGTVHPELRSIRLAANVGQSAATAAGLRVSRGKWVATLD